MKNFSFHEFRPTIFFLLKFAGLYVVGNILYGVYVSSYQPKPDPATASVSVQTAAVLSFCGWSTTAKNRTNKPITQILYEGRSVLDIYEGCNGINTAIMFVAFIFAFGPWSKKMLWFIPLGALIIHIVNLGRITLLFWVSEYEPDFMYFAHKYIFTAILYVVIFGLWLIWVRKNSPSVK